MGRSDAILEGVQAARRLHLSLGSKQALQSGRSSRVDVFEAIIEEGALLLFRPLNKLLGAYLGPPEFARSGILVTTQRDLHVQRFTAAHELGHMVLQHEPSADEQVGLWRTEGTDLQETAADAFASEFMLPRWLYVYHCARRGWKSEHLRDPHTVYQLSLRIGASYEATCYGLLSHKILEGSIVRQLRDHDPKSLKLAALAGRAELTNSWADVWEITEADGGLSFEGGPDDIVVFRCSERASAGYLWNEEGLREQGFEILADEREERYNRECGGNVVRILVTRVGAPETYRVSIAERRPWLPAHPLAELSMGLDLHGKEAGLPRFARNLIVAA